MKQVVSDRGIEISIDITENVSDNTEKHLYNIIRKALRKSIKAVNRHKAHEESHRDEDEESQRDDDEESHRDEDEESQRDDEEESQVDTEEEEIVDTDDEEDILGDILGHFESMRDEKLNKKKIIESSIRDKDISILKKTIKELAKKNTDVPLIIKGLTKEERHWAHVNLSSINMDGIRIKTWSMNVNHERVFYFKIDTNNA
jgi:hypothetical protein